MSDILEDRIGEVRGVGIFRPLYWGMGSLLLGYLCEEFTGRESFLQNVYDSLCIGVPILMGCDVYFEPKDWLNVKEIGIMYFGLTAGQTLRNFLN